MNTGLEFLNPSIFGDEYEAGHWNETLPESANMDGFKMDPNQLGTDFDVEQNLKSRMPMADISLNSGLVTASSNIENGSTSKKSRKKSYPSLAKKPKPPKCRKYVSMKYDQIVEVQKEIIISEVLKCKSFVKPSRELSKKWGMLVTERTIERIYDDYISKFPVAEVSAEMLELDSGRFKSEDVLTVAERFEIFDRCENVACPDAAQIVYDCFGKIIPCAVVAKLLKNQRIRLDLSIDDRVGIVNMASDEGLVPATRFYAKKCNVDLNESMVLALTQIAGTPFKRCPCPASSVDPIMQAAISKYAKSHTLSQTANRFSQILGIPLSETAVCVIKNPDPSKLKRPVGRPRKYPKVDNDEFDEATPLLNAPSDAVITDPEGSIPEPPRGVLSSQLEMPKIGSTPGVAQTFEMAKLIKRGRGRPRKDGTPVVGSTVWTSESGTSVITNSGELLSVDSPTTTTDGSNEPGLISYGMQHVAYLQNTTSDFETPKKI